MDTIVARFILSGAMSLLQAREIASSYPIVGGISGGTRLFLCGGGCSVLIFNFPVVPRTVCFVLFLSQRERAKVRARPRAWKFALEKRKAFPCNGVLLLIFNVKFWLFRAFRALLLAAALIFFHRSENENTRGRCSRFIIRQVTSAGSTESLFDF